MARLMTAVRLGVVAVLALAILSAWGTFSFADVSATGRAGVSKVPALFKDKDNNKGNNGNGNGQGNGNGNAGQGDQQDDGNVSDDENGEKNNKAKKNKKDKSDKAKDQADDDVEGDSVKPDKSANVDCDDVEGMIEYLKNRNMNGAIHANENGADNAAAGALNKCMEHGPENADSDDDGTPVAEDGTPIAEDGTPVAGEGTPVGEDDDSDKPVTVNVDIDEDGNGVIEYDLDGDGDVDLTVIIEDGKVVDYVEAGAEDGTPEATPDAA
jgi:hypothetical protein